VEAGLLAHSGLCARAGGGGFWCSVGRFRGGVLHRAVGGFVGASNNRAWGPRDGGTFGWGIWIGLRAGGPRSRTPLVESAASSARRSAANFFARARRGYNIAPNVAVVGSSSRGFVRATGVLSDGGRGGDLVAQASGMCGGTVARCGGRWIGGQLSTGAAPWRLVRTGNPSSSRPTTAVAAVGHASSIRRTASPGRAAPLVMVQDAIRPGTGASGAGCARTVDQSGFSLRRSRQSMPPMSRVVDHLEVLRRALPRTAYSSVARTTSLEPEVLVERDARNSGAFHRW